LKGALYSSHSRNGIIESYSGEFRGIRNFNITHSITVDQGLNGAFRHVGAKVYAWDNNVRESYPDYTGTVYRLRQTSSGGCVQTFSLKNGTSYSTAIDITSGDPTSWSDATAVQAYWGAEQMYAFYFNRFIRNSFDNAGTAIKLYVHYSVDYVNAFWDGTRMTYGDGNIRQVYRPLVSLDICGHEITRGVTTYSVNVIYSKKPGALNESYSDIFGECIENYAKGSNDWMMSCDIGVNGNCAAFRSMSNPNQISDPDTCKGTYWYTGSFDYGGVHVNSGVQNKWIYILSNGETGVNDNGCNYTVKGIGIEKASRIAYRNIINLCCCERCHGK
jgi:bacillolysin